MAGSRSRPPALGRRPFPAIAALPEAAILTQRDWDQGGAPIVFANDAFCRLTGYTAAELVGQNSRLLHGSQTDLTLLLQERRASATPHEGSGEGWLCRKDGTPFYAQWRFRPFATQGRRLLVATYHDRSEFRQLREALLQSQKLDTVGLLAGGMAHDFSNLISVINGYCEIMNPKLAALPSAQRDLQEIHRAGLKAALISRQILEFSRRQETEVKVVNFNTLIREIAEIIRRVAGDEVTVELRLDSDLGNARIDPTHFQQILLNLCFNAHEAMPRGGKLTIRTGNQTVAPGEHRENGPAPGTYAVMQVIDTGRGIAPDTLARIFEPFFTTKPRGTGLGLANVQGIIQQYNGHISVQSTVGTGTRFEVLLPETAEPEQPSVTQLSKLPTLRGSETVLVVEDDPVLRKMIAGILATDGYRVIEAAAPRDASRALAGHAATPQLIMIPCNTRAAVAFVRRLRTEHPKLRLICTSAEFPANALEFIPAIARAHRPNPLALSSLIVTVRALLDGPAA